MKEITITKIVLEKEEFEAVEKIASLKCDVVKQCTKCPLLVEFAGKSICLHRIACMVEDNYLE